uniref:Single domain-containing protein n=1 Tax=Amblyomma maculatum TaxID=34609 RepID=G3MSA6_AMBMU
MKAAIFLCLVASIAHCGRIQGFNNFVAPVLDTNVTVVQGRCVYYGRKVRNGRSRAIKKPCVNVTCMAYAHTPFVFLAGCETFNNNDENCQVVKGENKPYPLCCPRLYCE